MPARAVPFVVRSAAILALIRQTNDVLAAQREYVDARIDIGLYYGKAQSIKIVGTISVGRDPPSVFDVANERCACDRIGNKNLYCTVFSGHDALDIFFLIRVDDLGIKLGWALGNARSEDNFYRI